MPSLHKSTRVLITNVVVIGSACRPYPGWRFPGWNRHSVGLHLDDCRKFLEDPDGGRDYETHGLLPSNGFTPGSHSNFWIGFGYEFESDRIFYTYDGTRLPTAFTGAYTPLQEHDVYAAIGMEGKNEFEVNFGQENFRWKEANDLTWNVGGHAGIMAGSSGGDVEALPSYAEAQAQP